MSRNNTALDDAEAALMPRVTDWLAALGGNCCNARLSGISRMTLPELFGITPQEQDLLWSLSAGRSLSEAGLGADSLGSSPCLSTFDELEILLASSIGYFADQCTDEHGFRQLFESAVRLFEMSLGRGIAFDVSLWPATESRLFFLHSMPVRRIPGAEPHWAVLNDLGLGCLGDLSSTSRDVDVEMDDFSIALIDAVEWLSHVYERALALEHAVLSTHAATDHECADVADFCEAVLTSLLQRAKANRRADERLVSVFTFRMGLRSHPLTLQECGERLGVTRERVRQLESKVFKLVDRAVLADALWPLHIAMWSALMDLGGAARRDRVNEYLSAAWEVPADAGYLTHLSTLFADISKATTCGDVLVVDEINCDACDVLSRVLDAIKDETEPTSLAQLSEMIWSSSGGCTKCGLDRPPSPEFLAEALSRRELDENGLVLGKAGLYGKGVGVRDPSTRAGQLLTALRNAGGPMHFTEVLAAVNEANPERPFTKGNVYSRLDTLDEAVSWDSGTFIHISNMPCPYGLVRKAEEWMRQGFKKSDYLPFVSSYGPFRDDEHALIDAGVPSALALYSLLRISGEKDFTFPRYPYVYRAAGFEGRSTLAAVMSEYIRRAGRVVLLSEIRHFVVDEMGFKQFQFDQRVYDLPDVLATDEGFVHRDYVRIDQATRALLLRHAEELVDREGHVSIDRVFNDKRVDCVLAGIRDPRFLYSIIETEDSELLAADRYPVLSRRTESESSRGIQLLVCEHLRRATGPVSLEQLEEEFVTKRHYRRGSVFAAAYRDDVFRYATASLVHVDVLGWDEDKKAQFEAAAVALYQSALARGELVAKTVDLVERAALPLLRGDSLWTQHLAADVIAKSERLVPIGNARNAFVVAQNPTAISSLGGLVGALVRDQFGGGVAVTELESVLRASGALARTLTPALIADERSVEMVGYEVRLVDTASVGYSHDASFEAV